MEGLEIIKRGENLFPLEPIKKKKDKWVCIIKDRK
jgi:hypothetical protein